jgi:hypothetical protein
MWHTAAGTELATIALSRYAYGVNARYGVPHCNERAARPNPIEPMGCDWQRPNY